MTNPTVMRFKWSKLLMNLDNALERAVGRLHGIPTPVNEMPQRVANDLARSMAPPVAMTEADLLALLDRRRITGRRQPARTAA